MADIEQLRPQRARVARKPASSRPDQRPTLKAPRHADVLTSSASRRVTPLYPSFAITARTLASAYSCAWQLLS